MFEKIKKIILWRWDRYFRYKPVIRFLKNKYHKAPISVLEVGSGEYSMGLYDGYLVDAIDIRPPKDTLYINYFINNSILKSGLRSSSYDVVVSVDTLEHIKPSDRRKALSEMVRIARKEVLLVYPEGKTGMDLDKKMYSLYKKKVSNYHIWLEEHVEYGLPKDSEVISFLSNEDKIRNIKSYKICGLKKLFSYTSFLMSRNYVIFLLKNKLIFLFDLFFGRFFKEDDFYRTFMILDINESD